MKGHYDPVCGKRININKAHIKITYEREEYYLCCPQCQREFERDPQKYIDKLNKHKSKKAF